MSTDSVPPPRPWGWSQDTLVEPEVINCTLQVGIIVRADHLQWMVTCTDAEDGRLLAQWSRHHAPIAQMPSELAGALSQLQGWIEQHVGPF